MRHQFTHSLAIFFSTTVPKVCLASEQYFESDGAQSFSVVQSTKSSRRIHNRLHFWCDREVAGEAQAGLAAAAAAQQKRLGCAQMQPVSPIAFAYAFAFAFAFACIFSSSPNSISLILARTLRLRAPNSAMSECCGNCSDT